MRHGEYNNLARRAGASGRRRRVTLWVTAYHLSDSVLSVDALYQQISGAGLSYQPDLFSNRVTARRVVTFMSQRHRGVNN